MLSRRREQYHGRAENIQDRPRQLTRTCRYQIEQVAVLDPADVFICEDRLVIEAMRFIKHNARRCLRVEDVAEHLNTSRSTLIRRFDASLGRTVASEIRRQRVAELKRLLTRTGRPIAEISSDYGFSSPGQLSRYFKRAVGVSPGDYRRGRVVPAGAVVYG